MKYIIFIGLFSLIAFSSCDKNENEKKTITPDLLNCCDKTNSYWVYIDSVSNNIDSVYVVNYNHYFHEYYVTDYTSYDQEYYDFITESTSSAESLNFTVTLDYLSRNYDGFGNRTTVYLDYNEEVSGYGYIFEHLDSAFIYDRYYKRVLKVEVLEDETVDNNKSIYFSNSDYGILRHDIYSDTVLLSSKLLMRKNIVR